MLSYKESLRANSLNRAIQREKNRIKGEKRIVQLMNKLEELRKVSPLEEKHREWNREVDNRYSETNIEELVDEKWSWG